MKLCIGIFLITLCNIAAMAEPVTRVEAYANAQRFLASHGIVLPQTAISPLKAQHTSEKQPYYVFSGDNTFVIAAGDSRMPAVLGYSDSGTLSPDEMPPALREMLDRYAAHVKSLPEDNDGTMRPTGSVSRKALQPLIKSKYGQTEPYNRMCPGIDSTGTLAPTGSVATAMAQVMRFNTWPYRMEHTVPGYLSESTREIVPELLPFYFPAWKPIKYYYQAADHDSTAVAVAALMRYCCQAAKTNFGIESTASTSQVVPALVECFDYAPTAQYVRRSYYSAEEWSQLIYDEIASRRPVIYRAGQHDDTGHAFIVDGADQDGMFHINWGWQGAGDGYYALSSLNPEAHIGTATSDGYETGAAMVIGITPNRNNREYTDPGKLTFYNLSVKQEQCERNLEGDAFEGVAIAGRFTNGAGFSASYDYGFALLDNEGNFVKSLYENTFRLLEPTYGLSSEWTLTIDGDITPGHYSIVPVSRVHGKETWNTCTGGEFNHVDVEITPTTLSLKAVGNAALASYKIDQVSLTGKLEQGRSITLDGVVTNAGKSPLGYIYLLVDGSTSSVVQCTMQPGESENIAMHFTVPATGTHSLQLALDKDGSRVIWSNEVIITGPQAAMLSCSAPRLSDIRPGRIIASGTMQATCTVTNDSTVAYNDEIVARVYRHTIGTRGSLFATVAKAVNLAPGESKTLDFSFEHLTADEMFSMTISYYSNGVLTAMTTTPFYTMLGDYKPGDLNADREIDITDVNLIINKVLGKPDIMDYGGRDDANNDGDVDISDINLGMNMVLGKD